MKVLLISGTNHKGSTYTIGRMLADKLNADEIKEVFLPKDMPKQCRGCTRCIIEEEAKCPDYSFIKPITDSIDEADILILTSPVYVLHVTGQMKSLLDHYAYRWMVHRPSEKMFSKQAVCISTAGGAGMKSTNKDMADSLKFWGVGRIYTYGVAVAATSWESVSASKKQKIEKKINRIAQKLKKRQNNVTPSFKVKVLFYLMRIFQKRIKINPVDYDYWEAKGWLGKRRPWKTAT